jgi:hypothetical protein
MLLDVELDAALVPVHAEEVGALALEEGWPPGTGLVAVARSLHFDDVGAEVTEQHRAIRARQRLRHVDDFDAGQWCNVRHERSRLCSDCGPLV